VLLSVVVLVVVVVVVVLVVVVEIIILITLTLILIMIIHYKSQKKIGAGDDLIRLKKIQQICNTQI